MSRILEKNVLRTYTNYYMYDCTSMMLMRMAFDKCRFKSSALYKQSMAVRLAISKVRVHICCKNNILTQWQYDWPVFLPAAEYHILTQWQLCHSNGVGTCLASVCVCISPVCRLYCPCLVQVWGSALRLGEPWWPVWRRVGGVAWV